MTINKENAYDDMKAIAMFLAQNGLQEQVGRETFDAPLRKLVSAGFDKEMVDQYAYHAVAMIRDGESEGITQKSLKMIHYVQDKVNQKFGHDQYAQSGGKCADGAIVYSDKDKEKIGKYLASVFKLKKSSEHKNCYAMGEGHLNKTAIGVFNTVVSISESIKTGKIKTQINSNSL